MTTLEFSVAGILLGCFALLMCAFFCVAYVRGLIWRRRNQASTALIPEIRETLVDYLAGSNDQTRIRKLVKRDRSQVADVILSFQGTVGGGALDRLCNLALELGLVYEWLEEAHSRDAALRRTAFARMAFVSVYEPCCRAAGELLFRALGDLDPEVRLWASRGVVVSGTREQVEKVFELAISQSLLLRILLTEVLRRHAGVLCERSVPAALRSSDPQRVLAVLDILVAWERAIPVDNLRDLLDHPNKHLRIQAIRLAPLVPLAAETRAAIVRALGDSDPDVNTAAALSAARLKLEEALPSLARMLRLAPAELARTAAAALAEMPPRGWQALEELSANPNAVTAGAASAALALARRRARL